MRLIKITFLFVTSQLVFTGLSKAQTSADLKYTVRAKEVEEELSGENDALFTSNTVPANYSQASAVIIAKKVSLFSDLKSKMKFSIFYGSSTTNNIRYTLT